jgi:hypothetical protein
VDPNIATLLFLGRHTGCNKLPVPPTPVDQE